MGQETESLSGSFLLHAQDLAGLARLLVGGNDSQDLVQDTFLAAMRQSSPPRRLQQWLRQVLRNRAKDVARGRTRRSRREELCHTTQEEGLTSEEEVLRQELVTAILSELRALAPLYRVVIERIYLDNASSDEVAKELQCSAATVRWRVHEGIKRIRTALDKRYDGRNEWTTSAVAIYGLPWTPASSFDFVIKPACSSHRFGGIMQANATAKKTFVTAHLFKMLAAGTAIAGGVFAFTRSDNAQTAAASEPFVDSTPTSAIAPAPAMSTAAKARPESAREPPVVRQLNSRTFAQLVSQPAATDDFLPCPTDQCAQALALTDAECEGVLAPPAGAPVIWTKISWQLGDDGMYPIVESTTGCFEPELLPEPAIAESAGELPCSESVRPTASPKATLCALREVLRLELPEFPDDPGGLTSLPTIVRRAGTSSKPGEPELPAVSAEVANLADSKLVAQMHAPRMGSSDDDEIVVVCGTYSVFDARHYLTMKALLARHPETQLIWLQNRMSQMAGTTLLGKAAVAAQRQGKFWQMHEVLFDATFGAPTIEEISDLARSARLDLDRFMRDLHSQATLETLAAQTAWCEAHGGKGAPSTMYHGQTVGGARPLEDLEAELQM